MQVISRKENFPAQNNALQWFNYSITFWISPCCRLYQWMAIEDKRIKLHIINLSVGLHCARVCSFGQHQPSCRHVQFWNGRLFSLHQAWVHYLVHCWIISNQETIVPKQPNLGRFQKKCFRASDFACLETARGGFRYIWSLKGHKMGRPAQVPADLRDYLKLLLSLTPDLRPTPEQVKAQNGW